LTRGTEPVRTRSFRVWSLASASEILVRGVYPVGLLAVGADLRSPVAHLGRWLVGSWLVGR
jgi:hypothetical protein